MKPGDVQPKDRPERIRQHQLDKTLPPMPTMTGVRLRLFLDMDLKGGARYPKRRP